MNVRQFQPGGEVGILGPDFLEDRLVVAHDVHLIDGHDNVADAQQRDDETMPLRLREHAMPGIDQNDRQISRRGTRCHVPRVLLVAGRVGDDKLALIGREIAVGDVDCDPLLPLVFKPVSEQSQVEFLTGGAIPRGVFLDGGELVFVDHLRLVEESANERALAVVDAAAGDEPQQFLPFVLFEVGVDVGGN